MSENTTTTKKSESESPPKSLEMKFMYSFIVLLWIAAGAAVYVTFFSEEARQQITNADSNLNKYADVEGLEPAEVDEAQKKIVFNSQGEVVDPEAANELPRALEPFTLTNQSGETIGLEELKGKPWVGTFVFTSCPGPCSMITGRMKQLQSDLEGVDFNLVSVTVDPKNDTPEKLTKYADAFTADLNNWQFLTGDAEVIYELIRGGFKMPVAEMKPGDIMHTNRFVVVDADGNYVDSFIALKDDEYFALKKRIRELAEASQEDSPVSEPESVGKASSGEESETP
ncbi:MAG: SCO family protein [Planctomycetaceae bacterium]|nr:SCO family protein [Planctomycetaceae bacterium]